MSPDGWLVHFRGYHLSAGQGIGILADRGSPAGLTCKLAAHHALLQGLAGQHLVACE